MQIAIVENEDKDIQTYKDFLIHYQNDEKEKIDFTIFRSGVDILSDYNEQKKGFDAIFMDIDMPFINGLTTSEKIREKDKDVILIFVTNLAHYAIQGYKVQAMDFLLKPLQYNDFKLELQKIKRNTKSNEKNSLWIPQKGATIKVLFKDIIYIDIFRHDIVLHTEDNEYKFRGTLSSVENDLNQGTFQRVNNYTIVNLAYVSKIKKESIELQDGSSIPFSRNRKKPFMDAFTMFLNGDF